MEDREIVKALKEILELMLCEGDLQRSAPISNALDLINRLQAENERFDRTVKEYAYLYDKHINTPFNHIKASAYKEFAERLKEDISNHRTEMYMNGLKGAPRTKEITYECVEEYIDNLLKELEEK